MAEKIAEWIEKLATGKKARIFWATSIAIFVIGIVVFPAIDANFIFYGRIETRINNLEKLVAISGQTISDVPSLNAEYQDILNDMETARSRSSTSPLSGINRTDISLKFWSGSVVGLILCLAGIFNKNPAGKMTFKYFLKNNILIIVIGLIIAVTLGYFFTFIPTVGTVWINVITAPIIQFIFLSLLLTKPKKGK